MDLVAFGITIGWVYLLCFCIGLFYAIFTGIFTGFFSSSEGAHLDAGGADADVGVDVGGHDFDVGGHDLDVGGHDLDVGGHGVDVGGHDLDVGGHDLDAGGHDLDVGDHDVGAGGHDAAAGDHDGAGGGHEGAHDGSPEGEVHFSPLSPIVIAMFLVAFGAAGLIATEAWHLTTAPSLPMAAGGGFVVAALTYLFFSKLIAVTEASSEASVAALIGTTAEVLLAIPRDGLGEIAYVAKGSRYTAPARSATGTTIAANSTVIIRRIVGSTFYVALKD